MVNAWQMNAVDDGFNYYHSHPHVRRNRMRNLLLYLEHLILPCCSKETHPIKSR
jgi:hypothetical protein